MPGKPQAIKDVLAQLMAHRGYARQQSAATSLEAWRTAAGDAMAKFTRPGNLRRGVLEVFVANSTLMQELSFQKAAILARLQASSPDDGVRDLRFRVGVVS